MECARIESSPSFTAFSKKRLTIDGSPSRRSRQVNAGIVVSVDGSADSQHALAWAATHAALEHAPLTVLAVHRVAASAWTGNPILYPGDRVEAQRVLKSVEKTVSKTIRELGDDRPSTVTVRGSIGPMGMRSSRHRTTPTWSFSEPAAAGSPG